MMVKAFGELHLYYHISREVIRRKEALRIRAGCQCVVEAIVAGMQEVDVLKQVAVSSRSCEPLRVVRQLYELPTLVFDEAGIEEDARVLVLRASIDTSRVEIVLKPYFLRWS